MTVPRPSDSAPAESADSIAALYEARARAELRRADRFVAGADVIPVAGSLLAQVAVVKGCPGPAEAAGGAALSGRDGEAVLKALEALGWMRSDVFFTLSRPVPGADPDAVARRVRLQIEAVDPELVIALDAQASEDVARAFGQAVPAPGVVTEMSGRRVLGLDAFEAALDDEDAKRRAWNQLKAGRPLPGSF